MTVPGELVFLVLVAWIVGLWVLLWKLVVIPLFDRFLPRPEKQDSQSHSEEAG